MRSPLESGTWERVSTTISTQADLIASVKTGGGVGVLQADHQTDGQGRFGRSWYSEEGRSLTMSMALPAYANHPRPWLVGMAVGLAAAAACHCKIAWPNDLVLQSKKVGGILTELVTNPDGKLVPVVGIGINVGVLKFPSELETAAGNMHVGELEPDQIQELAQAILDRIETLPEPDSWASLRGVWNLFDATPGKQYRTPAGEDAVGIGIGPEGELICSVDGETQSVLAADAIFGVPAS